MDNRKFYYYSTLCILIGTFTLTAGYWLRPDIKKELIDEFAGTTTLISSILVAAGTLILLCGLPAFFAKQYSSIGRSGLIASGLTFTGIAAFHLGTVALYFVMPVLVTHNAATRELIYSDSPPFPLFALFWALTLFIQSVGLIWLGIKLWKANRVPFIGALLMMAGGLTLICAPLISFELLKPATTIVMLSLAWCSVSMVNEPAKKSP